MWNEEFKWFYEEGTPNGYNDTGISEFKSTKYDGLAREIIQNSLDARKDENEPVKVVFEQKTFSMDLFPDVEGYIDTVERCIEFLKNDKGNKSIDKLKLIKDCLEYCKKRGSYNVLQISDYNTKGLAGSNKTYGTPWSNLVRISGNSNKGPGAQGSFGIGKYAPFVFSKIRAIVYSTKDLEGNVAVQGKSILSGHIYNGNTRTPFGYYGKKSNKEIENVLHDDSAAIMNINDIPNEFVRNEIGTSIFILYATTQIGWTMEVLSSVINSFFYAIKNNKLIVEIIDNQNKIIVDSNTLEEQIQMALEKNPTKELKITKDYFTLVKNIDNAKEITHTFDLPNNKKGEMKLYLYSSKDIENKSIAHIRKAGMKIEDYSPKSLLPYAGICVTANDDMNEFLTNCEAPKHDAWSANNFGEEEEQTIAKRILNELTTWERGEVKQLVQVNESEKIDPLGMEEFLASELEGEIEAESNNIEIINFKPLDTEIKNKKNTKQTNSTIETKSGMSQDDMGEELIEGPNGSNNGNSGTGTGNGGQQTPGKTGSGNKNEKEKIQIKNIQTPYMNEPGKYIISFIPMKTIENCELKVRLAGEDVFENVKINNMYILDENGKHEIETFNIKENETITLEVHLENVNRAALEVNCYAKK